LATQFFTPLISVLSLSPGVIAADRPTGNLIYHPSLGFQIPFEIDPADKPFLKSIELYVSDDMGKSWRLSTATNPNAKAFKFRAVADGEYWFAVRTLDVEGRYNPGDDKPIVPDWRVVVDSKKPGLGLRTISRRGAVITVAWDARDEHLDMGTLVLEYSIPGSGEWKPIPIGRPAPNGETTWDCGTAEAIRVRATVADKAGNMQTGETQLSDGTAQRPEFASTRPAEMDGQAPAPIARMASAAGDRRGILGPQDPYSNRVPADSEWIETPNAYGPESMAPATRGSETGRMPRSPATDEPPGSSRGGNMPPERRQIPLLNTPRFPMNYVVDDAGPNGPATVELWVTRDGGKNWSRWTEDEDLVSPLMVDLGGEGVFGLSIVARSIAGQGDEIPRAGTPPQMSVEIDSTPPAMILNLIKVGIGSQSGKVLISWEAEDRTFGPRPISLFYRPETGNQWLPIVEGIDNTGQYVWTPGPQVPPVFHVRVEARDGAGNRSSVDTTQYKPVLLDRSRPKGRILGISLGQNDAPVITPNGAGKAISSSSTNDVSTGSPPSAGNRPSGRIAPIAGTGDEPQPAPPAAAPPETKKEPASPTIPAPTSPAPAASQPNVPELPTGGNGLQSVPAMPPSRPKSDATASRPSPSDPVPLPDAAPAAQPSNVPAEIPPPAALQDQPNSSDDSEEVPLEGPPFPL
jgi:hypothetical protein